MKHDVPLVARRWPLPPRPRPRRAAALNVVATTEDLAALAREVGGRQGEGRGHRPRLPGPALRGGQAQLHPEAAQGATCWSRSAASWRSAGCRRSSPRAATRRSSPARRATSTRRRTRASSTSPPGRSRGPWATCTRRATRTTGSTPATAGGWRRPSRQKLAELRPRRRGLLRPALRRLRPAAGRGREALGRGRWRPTRGTKIVTYHRSWPNFVRPLRARRDRLRGAASPASRRRPRTRSTSSRR